MTQVLKILFCLFPVVLWAEPVTLEAFAEKISPGATLEPEHWVFTEAQLAEVKQSAGSSLPGNAVHARKVMANGQWVARIYLDRHRVRTLPETLAIALSPEGKVLGVEVLVFAEPGHYKPRPVWLELFKGKSSAEPPKYKSNIDGISGATLTGRAVNNAVLRSLAIHDIIKNESTP